MDDIGGAIISFIFGFMVCMFFVVFIGGTLREDNRLDAIRGCVAITGETVEGYKYCFRNHYSRLGTYLENIEFYQHETVQPVSE